MNTPTIIVNAKAYQRGVADAAVQLAKACEKRDVILAVQAADIYRITSETNATVFAQHIDPVSYGSHTGAVLPESVVAAGASGTLLNHAEKQIPVETIRKCIIRAREVGLTTVVCSDSLEHAKQVALHNPDFIALELPELIGGDVSITSADPQLIQQAAQALGDKLLVGAGVSNNDDLQASLNLGANGVLLASAVVKKAQSYEQALTQLLG